MRRFYVTNAKDRAIQLDLDKNEPDLPGWLFFRNADGDLEVHVLIVPAARSGSAQTRAERVRALKSQVEMRCSNLGVQLLEEYTKALTSDITQRYEAIIEQRVQDSIKQRMPKEREVFREELEAAQARITVQHKLEQLAEVGDQRAGVYELRAAFNKMSEVLTKSACKLEALEEQLRHESRVDAGPRRQS